MIILIIILLLMGWAIYQRGVYVIRKWTGLTNIRKIRFRALVATFILTPLLILLFIVGLVLYTILNDLKGYHNLNQRLDKSLYDKTSYRIDQMHLQGKTKSEVVDLLGKTDTTYNELIYNLSMNRQIVIENLDYTPETLFLVVTIKNGKVIRYNLKREE